jgi:hypothetical protein
MKTLINILSKTVIVLVAIFTMSFSQTTGTPGKAENPAELKYIGSKDNQPQFQLNLNNTEADEFVVTIRNKTGEIVYKEKVSGSLVSRKYQLNTEDSTASGFTFEVLSKKSKTKIAYSVNETSRMVQDISITAL